MSNAPSAAPHPDKGRTVRAMFDAIAPRYDLANAVLSFGLDRAWRRTAVRRALAKGPARVLDVATGTGDMALALAAAAPSAEVTGVDFAEAMLSVAERKADARGAAVDFQVADGSDLPFPDGSFDVVTIAFGLRNFADPDAGLREFRRVLDRDGRLVVLDFPPPPPGLLGSAYAAYFTRVLPIIGGALTGHRAAYAYLPASAAAFLEPSRLADRTAAAGFGAVSFETLTFGVAALHVADVAAPAEERGPS